MPTTELDPNRDSSAGIPDPWSGDCILTATEDGVTVQLAIPSEEQVSRIFGVPLAEQSVQPIWIRIVNTTDVPYWILPIAIDPDYFTADDAALATTAHLDEQEVADAMSTTHQNVKQLAIRLEARGFLNLERDPKNKRILRLKVTEECSQYWEKRTPGDIKSITSLFQGLEDGEVKSLFEIMAKMEKTSGELYQDAKNLRS